MFQLTQKLERCILDFMAQSPSQSGLGEGGFISATHLYTVNKIEEFKILYGNEMLQGTHRSFNPLNFIGSSSRKHYTYTLLLTLSQYKLAKFARG